MPTGLPALTRVIVPNSPIECSVEATLQGQPEWAKAAMRPAVEKWVAAELIRQAARHVVAPHRDLVFPKRRPLG